MTALRIASRLLGLLSASALLMCGALAAAGVPWVPRWMPSSPGWTRESDT